MEQDSATLARFYTGWEQYQRWLTEAIAPLSSEQLALRAAPHLRAAWELAAHIISARVYWFHRVMGEGDADLAPMQAWDDEGEPERSAAELVEGLNATWRIIDECLRRWTPDALDDTHRTPRGREYPRQWIIWHVIEHDLHHGGELFFTLGMHGLPTPDL